MILPRTSFSSLTSRRMPEKKGMRDNSPIQRLTSRSSGATPVAFTMTRRSTGSGLAATSGSFVRPVLVRRAFGSPFAPPAGFATLISSLLSSRSRSDKFSGIVFTRLASITLRGTGSSSPRASSAFSTICSRMASRLFISVISFAACSVFALTDACALRTSVH